jgi:RNase H-like domain found in reverse transcriptase
LFYSRKLLPAEKNYTTADKEMLAIVQIMKKYRHYLQGTKFPMTVKSDHRNLQTFMTTKTLNARQARWAEELSNYDFVIEHIKGKLRMHYQGEKTIATKQRKRARRKC